MAGGWWVVGWWCEVVWTGGFAGGWITVLWMFWTVVCWTTKEN